MATFQVTKCSRLLKKQVNIDLFTSMNDIIPNTLFKIFKLKQCYYYHRQMMTQEKKTILREIGKKKNIYEKKNYLLEVFLT